MKHRRAALAVTLVLAGLPLHLRPPSGWSVEAKSASSIGAGAYVPGDVDGDGIADLVVYRPTEGNWYVQRSTTQFTNPIVLRDVVTYDAGPYPLFPVPVDFDGDRRMDLTSFIQDIWNTLYSSGWYVNFDQAVFPDGAEMFDYPLLGDFNGDDRSDLVVYRQRTREWHVRTTGGAPSRVPAITQWGLPFDIPVAADFDGDRLTDLAVWRPGPGSNEHADGTWHLLLSTTGYDRQRPWVFQWGLAGDLPVPGDFDGDGRADLAVWRISTGTWYVAFSSSGYSPSSSAVVQWGLPGDIPVANDYDGDGRLDYGVWRPSNGTWYLLLSTHAYSYAAAKVIQWGLPTDLPVSPSPVATAHAKRFAQ